MQNDLAMKARNGDQEALLQLWQGVSRLAYRIAFRYHNAASTNGAADDDDLKQCAFLGFFEALTGFDPLQGNFPTYMCWYVRNACRRLLGLNGRNRKEHYLTDSLDAALPGAEDLTLADTIPDEGAVLPFEQAELRNDVEKALHRLPDNIRELIRLHDLDGLTMAQAAREQDVSLTDACRMRRRGLCQLRRDRDLRVYNTIIPLRYKSLRAFKSDWTSVVEAEVIWRVDGK